MKQRGRRGFTLIELLVVIAIIGILSSIAMSQMAVGQAKARDARRLNDIHALTVALHLFYDDNGRYPRSPSEIIGVNGSGGAPNSSTSVDVDVGNVPSFLRGLTPTYLPYVFVDPRNKTVDGKEYEYRYIVDVDGSWCGGRAGNAYLMITNYETRQTSSGDSIDTALCPNQQAYFQAIQATGYAILVNEH